MQKNIAAFGGNPEHMILFGKPLFRDDPLAG